MAEGKKGVIVYTDWIELYESLSDEEAGKLIKHFFRYINDQDPIAPDRVTELSFTLMKQSLKRDLKKWEKTSIGRSKAGKASAESRKNSKEQMLTKSTNVENIQQSSTNSTDRENVTVNVKDNVNETEREKEEDPRPLIGFETKSLEILKEIDMEWKTSIAERFHIESFDEVNSELKKFCNHLFDVGDLRKTVKDFKSHYVNLKNKNSNFLNGKPKRFKLKAEDIN